PVSSGSSGAASTVRKQPTAPWSTTVKPPAQSDLLRAALSGRRFFNEAATTLDLQTKSSGDYRKLFALNQGLSLLESITNRAGQKGVSASETALLAKRFDAGMAELSAYLKDAKFDGIRMVEGESATKAQTGAAVARDSAKYVTGAVHTGTEYAPVEAFQGDVKFNISVKTTGGTKTIAIDLAEMGAETRTMQSVVAHINGKLEAAGVQTRMSRRSSSRATRPSPCRPDLTNGP
ncbi:MAG: transcriptional regulator, partial [Brevundimonas sp.]